MQEKTKEGWIGVALDGTLAYYDEWRGVDHIGEPIPAMVEKVKSFLRDGYEVKIFTARMAGHNLPVATKDGWTTVDVMTPIQKWCVKHIGAKLSVTNIKDFGMIALYDDRAIQVKTNTGEIIC